VCNEIHNKGRLKEIKFMERKFHIDHVNLRETIPHNIEEESNDALKQFTNIRDKEFYFEWDSKSFGGFLPNKEAIQPNETIGLPKYLANFAAYTLAKTMVKQEALDEYKDQPEMIKHGKVNIVNPIKQFTYQLKILKDSIPQEIIDGLPRDILKEIGFIKEEPKEEKKEEGSFKCETCEFEAKSEFGLRSHMRKHK